MWHLYIELNAMKLKYFIQLYKSMFRVQDHTKGFWYVAWEASGYYKNCVWWFISVILSFNSLCKQFKDKVVQCYSKEIEYFAFGNIFLTASKERENHL